MNVSKKKKKRKKNREAYLIRGDSSLKINATSPKPAAKTKSISIMTLCALTRVCLCRCECVQPPTHIYSCGPREWWDCSFHCMDNLFWIFI